MQQSRRLAKTGEEAPPAQTPGEPAEQLNAAKSTAASNTRPLCSKPLIPCSLQTANRPQLSKSVISPPPTESPSVQSYQQHGARATVLDKFVRPFVERRDRSWTSGISKVESGPITPPPASSLPAQLDSGFKPPVRPQAVKSEVKRVTVGSRHATSPFRDWFLGECKTSVDKIVAQRKLIVKSDEWPAFHRRCSPLSDDDLDAILLYTSTLMYITLNETLREGSDDQKMYYQPWTNQMESTIAKLPPFTGIAYRVLNNNTITMEYSRDSEVVWPAFTSCSALLSEDIVKAFGANEDTDTDDSSSVLVIHVARGRVLGPLNPYDEKEKEVLLASGWAGKVIDTVHRDVNGISDGLDAAGKSTVIELIEEGHERAPLETPDVDMNAIDSLCSAARLHHMVLPIFLRNFEAASAFYKRAIELCRVSNPHGDLLPIIFNQYGNLLKTHLKRPEEAEACYMWAICLSPLGCAAYYNYANLLKLVLKRYEEAAKYYELTLMISPDHSFACSNYADMLVNPMKRHDEAAKYYKRAIELDSSNVVACRNYAVLLTEHFQRHEEAAAYLRKAIQVRPTFAELYRIYADLLAAQLGKNEDATKNYEQAIRFDPSNAHYRLAYGKHLSFLKRNEEAERSFLKGLDLKPNSVDLCLALRDFLNRPELAGEYLERALKVDPQNAVLHQEYAQLQKTHFKDFQEAEASFKQAVALDPNNFAACMRYGILLDEVSQHEKAAAFHERAVQLDPTSGDANFNYAAVLRLLNPPQYDKSEEYFKRAIELDPKNASAFHSYGTLLADVFGKHDEAEKQYKQAIEVDPRDSLGWMRYANLLWVVRKDLRKAAEFFEQAIMLDPRNAVAHGNYAEMLSRMGNHRKAAEYFERELALDPTIDRASVLLQKCQMERFKNAKKLVSDRAQPPANVLEDFIAVMRLDRSNAAACITYAVLLVDLMDGMEAIQVFERAIHADTDRGSLTISYAELVTKVLELQQHNK